MITIYRKCWKCGDKVAIEVESRNDALPMCTAPMPMRTSGICGGTYSEEMTQKEVEEFVELLNKK